jgi:hypothetical protein
MLSSIIVILLALHKVFPKLVDYDCIVLPESYLCRFCRIVQRHTLYFEGWRIRVLSNTKIK